MTRAWMLASLLALLTPTSGRAADPQNASTAAADQSTTQTCTLKVSGMTCASCDVAVRLAAKSVSGVTAVKVDYARARADVTYDPSKTNPQAIAAAITKVSGFKAAPVKPAQK